MQQPHIDYGWVRDEILTAPVLRGPDSDRPWHRWEIVARNHGVADDLAQLGSWLMALSFAQDWPIEMKYQYGWFDGGGNMLHFALNDPQEARRCWMAVLQRCGQVCHAA